MTWGDYFLYKRGDETTRDLHVLNVYSDPDFNADITEATHGEPGNFMMATMLNPDNDEKSTTIDQIARKYRLTIDEVMHYCVGLRHIMPLPRDRPFEINWDEYDDYAEPFSITFTNDIKKQDYLQLWGLIERRQAAAYPLNTKKRRNRTLENDKLVYAVFKARLRGKKFSQIFREYETSSLDGYQGSIRQFSSEESLERYYDKYKPSETNS